jgi:GT2 family glycosyltransferase
MTSLSVVIPVYNNWAGCHRLLFDLYKNNSLIEEVILVDDASPDPAVQGGIKWWVSNKMLPIEVITNKSNQGFLKSANLGMKHAVEDVVCLISTDVRILGDLVKLLKTYSPDNKWLMGGRLYDASTGWNEFDGKVFPYLEGWLLSASKNNWEELGYFDVQYAPNDFEDVDLSTTAISKGFELLPLESRCTVIHEGAQSIGYGEERTKLTEQNRKKFETKWVKNADKV